MRRLGIDLGTVRTGLAVAEQEVPVATPLCTVSHTGFAQALQMVAEWVVKEQIDEAVVGLPLDLAGRGGEAARRAKQFAKALAKRTGIPVVLWDERLSTLAAERSLRSQGLRGTAKRRVVDQIAATLLLQSYLDREAHRAHQAQPDTGTPVPRARGKPEPP
jgi:putative Holliday junction resolvase